MSKKRTYTMSEKALEQRRKASPAGAAAATGPITPEGKAISSRNAYVHGGYSRGAAVLRLQGAMPFTGKTFISKPCHTTCASYPCSLVKENITQAGGDCLDKTVYLEAFDGIMRMLSDPQSDAMNIQLAMHAAGALDTLHQLRKEIAETGFLLKNPIFDKEGNEIGFRYSANPILGFYIEMLNKMGINLPELMATPMSRSKIKTEQQAQESISSVLSAAFGRLAGGKPKVIDSDAVDVDDAK